MYSIDQKVEEKEGKRGHDKKVCINIYCSTTFIMGETRHSPTKFITPVLSLQDRHDIRAFKR